ncbi:hypothetical protein ACHAWF_013082, partial [Thalassiosira exigua]
PSSLRRGGTGTSGGPSGGGDPLSASDVAAAGRKRRRPRRRDSSSSEEGGGSGGEEDTSDLLEQIRREREGDAGSKKKPGGAPLINVSSTGGKKKAKGGGGNEWMHKYKSHDGGGMTAQEMATRTAEYHPTKAKISSEDGAEGGTAAETNAQIAALQKQPRNKFLAGPIRAATFVRTTTRFDYQPDICKDYKETGFCGFGDTCIYLHDRGDTKTGWQMEAEYEEQKKKEAERKGKEMERFMNSMMCGEVVEGGAPGDEDDGRGGGESKAGADDGIPFACHICREAFKNPIVTGCAHYFCEGCILGRIREGGTGCPVCSKDTNGVLNHPQKLVAKKRRLVGRDGTWEEYLEKSRRGNDEDGD